MENNSGSSQVRNFKSAEQKVQGQLEITSMIPLESYNTKTNY